MSRTYQRLVAFADLDSDMATWAVLVREIKAFLLAVDDRLPHLLRKSPAWRRKNGNDAKMKLKPSALGSRPKKLNESVVLSVRRKKKGNELPRSDGGLKRPGSKEKLKS